MSFVPDRTSALDGVRRGLIREAASNGPSLVAWNIGPAHFGGSEASSDSVDEGEERVQALARRACDLLLVPDSGTAPLVPRRAGRLPTDVESLRSLFQDEDLAQLESLADERAPAALRARVHDLRWVIQRDTESADVALASYLEIALAADLGRSDEAHAAGDALLRAANLGLERHDTPRVESVFRELLPRALEQSPPAPLHRFFQAAEHLRGVGRIFLANLAITRAENEMSRSNHGWARTFFAHGRRSLMAVYRSEDAKTLAAMRAHVLAEEARAQRDAGQPAWVAASFLDYALEELRLLQGTREQLSSLEEERDALLSSSDRPEDMPGDQGRMAMALDEVLRAYDGIDPLLRWRFFGMLPIDPPAGAQVLGRGSDVLDLFLRRFGESASGRVLCLSPSPAGEAPASPDSREVVAWTGAVTRWLVPVLAALRTAEPSDPGLHVQALDHLLESSSAGVRERAAHLRRGLEAAWDGEFEAAIENLLPEVEALRSEPFVRETIRGSQGLGIVERALFEDPDGIGLTRVEGPRDASVTLQAQSDLLLWWTLRLIGVAAERPPEPALSGPLA